MEIKINEQSTPSVEMQAVVKINPRDRLPENWDIVPSDKNEMWFVYNNKVTGSHFEGPKSEFKAKFLNQ